MSTEEVSGIDIVARFKLGRYVIENHCQRSPKSWTDNCVGGCRSLGHLFRPDGKHCALSPASSFPNSYKVYQIGADSGYKLTDRIEL